jgi:hypothetical protein
MIKTKQVLSICIIDTDWPHPDILPRLSHVGKMIDGLGRLSKVRLANLAHKFNCKGHK